MNIYTIYIYIFKKTNNKDSTSRGHDPCKDLIIHEWVIW